MGSLKGVNITRGTLGANVLDRDDAICGLLANGVAVTADAGAGILGIAVGQTVKITSLKEAAAYGIDKAYDTANNVRVFRHISEFFRICGEGNTLYLMFYPGKPDAAFGATYGKKMIADAEGKIRMLAVSWTPQLVEEAPDLYEGGFGGYMSTAIPAAQEFYDWAFGTFRPCQIVLEGYGYDAVSVASAPNLRELTVSGNTYEGFKVSVCIGQDYKFADGLDAVGKKMADVGSMLGSLAYRNANQNIGEVAGGDLMDAKKEKWLVAGLSNHQTIADMDGDLEDLDTKGYIFAIRYAGYAGLYWNNDHTATPIIQDEDGRFNEYTISYGRVHDKAVRDLRNVLLPYVKSTQPVDKSTGLLPRAIVANFEAIGDGVFQKMIQEGLISAGKTTVDATSNLLVSPRELKVSFVIVPTGQIDEIKGVINLKTSI
jgi:hypothetical protein